MLVPADTDAVLEAALPLLALWLAPLVAPVPLLAVATGGRAARTTPVALPNSVAATEAAGGAAAAAAGGAGLAVGAAGAGTGAAACGGCAAGTCAGA